MSQYPNHPPPVYQPYYQPPPPYYQPPPPSPATYPTYPTGQSQQPAGKYHINPHQQNHAPPYQPPASYPTVRPQAHQQPATPYQPPVTYPTGQSQPPDGKYHNPQQQNHAPQYYPPHQPPATYQQPGCTTYPHQQHATPYYAAPPPYYNPNPPPPVQYYNPQPEVRPVVGPQYCVGRPVDLVIVRKVLTLTDDFVVRDVNKNVLFKAKGKILTLHDNRLISDASGKPVMTLRHKILTAHSRWQVYKGDSSEAGDLLFTAKTSSIVQFKTKLNVYLSHRTSEDVCDYRVTRSLVKSSCVVYVGQSKTIAAQMQKKGSVQSMILGKDKFMVTVSPNVDYAFVAALIVILDSIKNAADVSVKVIRASVLGPI